MNLLFKFSKSSLDYWASYCFLLFLFFSFFYSFSISLSTSGVSNYFNFFSYFSFILSYYLFIFSSSFLCFFSLSFKKYSPVYIWISSSLGYYSGGKGVYSFLTFFFDSFFFTFYFLNLGKNLSQFYSYEKF